MKKPETKIILGGSHATHMFQEILNNRNCFDYLVLGQGEYALENILNNLEKQDIKKFGFRDKINKIEYININKLPFADYSILNLDDYHMNFQNHYPQKTQKKGMPIYSST